MMKAIRPALALLFLVVVDVAVSAQSKNLLQNPNAEQGLLYWRAYGKATVAECSTASTCFVLGNDDYILQDVPIAKEHVGWFAVLIGRATSESLKPGGNVVGWPSLYGYMMDPGNSTSGYVYEYLQEQNMDGQPKASGEWIKLWGIYKVPEKTGRIRLFLHPGCKTAKTPDGCTSRFRDAGIYLFSSEAEAKSFVSQY
jgi:hypothetical protein